MLLLLAAYSFAGDLLHQGRLLDPTGLPIEGAQQLDVDIFLADQGGTPVWHQDYDVTFEGGYFAVILGEDAEGLDLTPSLIAQGLWVQLGVNDAPIGARTALRSVPSAMHTDTATNLSGGTVDAQEFRLNGSVVLDGSGVFPVTVIPDLPAERITSGTLDTARLDVGDEPSQVASGDHNHTAFPWSQQDMLAQLQAQAACVGMRGAATFVFAVPRSCNANTPSCATICSQNSEPQAGGLSCFNALHIYGNATTDDLNVDGLKTVIYNSCANTSCGPNFCCCQG